MDIEILKPFEIKPEYKRKIFVFQEVHMKLDIKTCISLNYCIIPSKKFLYEIFDREVHFALQFDVINWWNRCRDQRFCNDLYICKLKDDTKNTLFASASIAMWGFQDERFFERLCVHCQEDFKRRGLKFESSISSSRDPQYLPDVNTHILSNILKRPIIIFQYVEKYKSVVHVYLPLYQTPAKCCKQPLILAFYYGKYYPMLQMEDSPSLSYPPLKDAVPLETEQGNFRCVHYLKDPNSEEEMMEKYMDIVKIQNPETIGKNRWTYQNLHGYGPFEYYCARIEKNTQNRPFYYKDFKDYYMREHPNSSK